MDKAKSIKFVFEGQESKIKLVYRGRTTIALIVVGKGEITLQDHADRAFCGMSICHPKDDYDIREGIKQACRNALGISEHNGDSIIHVGGDVLHAEIYREIRETLNPHPWGVSKESDSCTK